tara:strand:+ start:475 stop:1032 length:558 start_codon:yes stop_codon:yes gene_type:complete
MKFKKILLILLLFFFSNVEASKFSLEQNYISLKDFILLKYEMFIQQNVGRILKGGGVMNVKYQKISYDIKIDKSDNILISIDAVMDKKRYTAKRYFPKLKDCNQIRNKIFTNKYGYSLFSQKFNNLVNENSLSDSINKKILNISTLDDDFRGRILDKTNIAIKIFHPNIEKNISCSGKITNPELN